MGVIFKEQENLEKVSIRCMGSCENGGTNQCPPIIQVIRPFEYWNPWVWGSPFLGHLDWISFHQCYSKWAAKCWKSHWPPWNSASFHIDATNLTPQSRFLWRQGLEILPLGHSVQSPFCAVAEQPGCGIHHLWAIDWGARRRGGD